MKKMSVKLIVLIVGCFGAGKTTLAKKLLNLDGGWINHESYAVSKGGLFTCAGTYFQNKVHGGADRLKNTQGIPILIANASTPCFFIEGKRATCFGPSTLVPMFSVPNQLVIYLKANANVVYKRLYARGTCKTTPSAVERYVNSCEALAQKFSSIGVRVVQLDTERASPTEIANFTFGEIQRFITQPTE